MIRVIIERFIQMIFVLAIVSVIVFVFSSMIGDPVSLIVPENATDEEIAAAERYLGLDKPIYIQYGIFVRDVLKGDFGKSFMYNQPAMKLIIKRIPATLEVVLISMILTGILAVTMGVFAGAYPKLLRSKLIMSGSLLGISLPSFWVGMMLMYLFAIKLMWLPPSGRGEVVTILGIQTSLGTVDGLKHLVLPAVTLSMGNIASLIRLIRAGMQENLSNDFVKFARAKGIADHKILYGHALKNALIPVVTIFGLQIGGMIAFTTITETIFAWPGMGKLLIDSIYNADKPVIVAYLMLISAMFVFINFTVDILYTVIDPRVELK